MRRQGKGDAFSRGTPWIIAAVLAVAWTPQLQANDIGRANGTSPPAQTVISAPQEPQAAQGQDHQNAEMLARELAATKNDLDVLVRLLNRACDESASAAPSLEKEAAETRQDLQ